MKSLKRQGVYTSSAFDDGSSSCGLILLFVLSRCCCCCCVSFGFRGRFLVGKGEVEKWMEEKEKLEGVKGGKREVVGGVEGGESVEDVEGDVAMLVICCCLSEKIKIREKERKRKKKKKKKKKKRRRMDLVTPPPTESVLSSFHRFRKSL
jgi:NTP pyrophosphatase (non-canonical NTP hydrolase)